MKDLAALRADGRRVQNVLIPLRPAFHPVSLAASDEWTVNTVTGSNDFYPDRPVTVVVSTVVGRTLAGIIVLGLVGFSILAPGTPVVPAPGMTTFDQFVRLPAGPGRPWRRVRRTPEQNP
jgi:hypothetical protein